MDIYIDGVISIIMDYILIPTGPKIMLGLFER